MATATLKGNPFQTSGDLPAVGSSAPDFELVRQDLSTATLETFAGMRKIVSIFPSIDTPTCAASVRAFNEKAASREDVVVLNVSADLPFAFKRFCAAEGIDGAECLSTFRGPSFADDYGVRIVDGPLKGLCARSIVVLDEGNSVLHTELVGETADEPNYDAALSALDSATTA